MNLRNLLALFYQVRAFLESSLGNEVITNMTNRMLTTNHLDSEWLALVAARFSAGMLSSHEADARADMFTREASIHIECDEQRKKVVEARLNFFQAALHRDQIKIARFKEVPKKIAQKQHLKTLAQHRLQAKNGEKAIKDYANKVLKVCSVDEVEDAIEKIATQTDVVATWLCLLSTAQYLLRVATSASL